MSVLSPIESEFATTEEAEAYDRWFRAKVEAAMRGNGPMLPHDEVMAQVRALIEANGVLRLVWSDDAREDLLKITGYIAERNPTAAEDLQNTIAYTAEQLPGHPYLYRQGRVPGTREAVVHPNYILVYRVGVDVIEILAVLHARQRYP